MSPVTNMTVSSVKSCRAPLGCGGTGSMNVQPMLSCQHETESLNNVSTFLPSNRKVYRINLLTSIGVLSAEMAVKPTMSLK